MMTPSFESQPAPEPNWAKPELENELGEIARTAEAFCMDKYELLEACENGEMIELSNEDWEQMKNADSRDTSWELEEVKTYLEGKRDMERIEKGFHDRAVMPAPIVLFRKDQPPYLIAGNSRLLMSRAINVQPKVWAVKWDK